MMEPVTLGFELLPAEPRCRGVRLTVEQLLWFSGCCVGRQSHCRTLVELHVLGLLDRDLQTITDAGWERAAAAIGGSPSLRPGSLALLCQAEVWYHLPKSGISTAAHVVADELYRFGLFQEDERAWYPTPAGSARVRYALGGGGG